MIDELALQELLSRPTPALVEAMAALPGDIVVLGAGGKMGPSLARLAQRASAESGVSRRVIAVARFTDPVVSDGLKSAGVETIRCDLLDPAQLARLPQAPNLIYMVGQKFGTTGDEARTWAVNAFLPGAVAERFPQARIVAFSTGNVYPLSAIEGDGPSESDPTGPIGSYAQSALARERVLEFFSRRNNTPMAMLRLNYAIEPRYGVLRDIADRVLAHQPVDLGVGKVNVIWQRDANAVALRALHHCSSPPLVLNLTGRPAHRVRWLAEEFGRRFRITPEFTGAAADTALLSDSSLCEALFGPAEVPISEMIARVAEWVEEGGRSLGKPTHFEARDGKF